MLHLVSIRGFRLQIQNPKIVAGDNFLKPNSELIHSNFRKVVTSGKLVNSIFVVMFCFRFGPPPWKVTKGTIPESLGEDDNNGVLC